MLFQALHDNTLSLAQVVIARLNIAQDGPANIGIEQVCIKWR
jgi:hypothetical protein